ncbi:MAG: hypothetical protein KAJ14_12955 [Candidatus Omnitrophica bacterium]|nr:hypothetical protein [Candidatus Omnitrophota bacterium]MCK5494013.1 hypothetical protein [Candidatus Omnitrophota bacterium]
MFNFCNLVLADESITITTYYPSPFGVFREIRATNTAIGDTYSDNTQYCWIGTCGTGIHHEASLVVEGNVGIGTVVPTSKLQVVGLIEYADNAAAIADGLTAGAFYRITGTGEVMVVF